MQETQKISPFQQMIIQLSIPMGSIDILVKRGDQYEPASAIEESITIVAKETLPTVSFVPPDPSSIDEGEDAVFKGNSNWSVFDSRNRC